MSANRPTAEAFLATIRKSGLVETERLQRSLNEYETVRADDDDGVSLAEFFVSNNVLTKWQAEKLLQGKHKGYFLGKYRLMSLLGKGGMSSVFLAEHILMRRRCAIKVLPTKRVADSSYLARFHREAQAVAALDHPNIVRAYDVDHQVDREAEIHFLVMEYVEGMSLQELVAKNGLTGFDDAVEYIRQAALGLESAHQAGMVHRDIKPGNLLVDPNGLVKLLDLGLARYFSSEDEGTALTIAHDEKVLGTADYLAPEQALDSHTVDHRADIYSLGCTLYFLLTGHPPFTEGTLAQRLMAHQTKEPALVEKDRPDVPPSLGAIVRKMMAKKADDRYSTAAVTADVMLQWLADHADPAWKQAHPKLFGGMRTSDTNLTRDTVAVPAKSVPVVSPILLTMTSGDVEPETEIVPRESWPTGDLAVAVAPKEREPELSAFLSQMDSSTSAEKDTRPIDQVRPPASSKVNLKSPATANASRTTPSPETPNLSFDFLGSAAAASPSKTPPPKGNGPVGTGPVKAANVPTGKPKSTKTIAPKPAAPKSTSRAPAAVTPAAAPVETAFPNFDFTSRPAAVPTPPMAPPQLVVEPDAKPRADIPLVGPISEILKTPIAIYAAAGVIGLAMLIGLGGYFLGWFSSESHDGPVRKSPPRHLTKSGPWTVRQIRVYGEDADYQTLQAALADARTHFQPNSTLADGKPDLLTILVAAGTHDEQIQIDGAEGATAWPDGIVIRGEGETIFTSAKDGPVMTLRDVTGLTLENLTIDAGDQPICMELSGFLTNSRVTQLRLRNFTEAGLVLKGAKAFSFDNPLRIEQVTCDAKSASAVGIRVLPSTEGGRTDDSNNVEILRCRLNGPLAAGVSLEGSVPNKIAVRETIFVKNAIGIRLIGPGRWQDFELTNNSFYQCPLGIAFTTMPDPVTSGLKIRRNLFVGTSTAEAIVQAAYNEPAFLAMLIDAAGAEANWSDRAAPAAPAAGEINLFAVNGKRGDVAFAFDSTDPKSPRFLAPTGTSPQRDVPNLREREQPWVGAIGK